MTDSPPILVALLSYVSYLIVCHWLPDGKALFDKSLYAFLVIAPSTLFIGATFPFAVRFLAGDSAEASGPGARIFAWNPVGAIAGAIGAAFVDLDEERGEETLRRLERMIADRLAEGDK